MKKVGAPCNVIVSLSTQGEELSNGQYRTKQNRAKQRVQSPHQQKFVQMPKTISAYVFLTKDTLHPRKSKNTMT